MRWYVFRSFCVVQLFYNMKTIVSPKICPLVCLGILFPFLIRAQVANWNFNNTLVGTGSANVTAANALLGPAIGSGAYNSNTVYFGEGGWPTGAVDPNAYIEFSITPASVHTVTVASMVLSIRRSTTGTGGSGPKNWALRSSLDGFSSDISNGTLSTAISLVPVTFNASFANLSTTVSFRLYGYNAFVSSGGGLNRFVFDNFSISGSSTTLPVVFDSFNATVNKETATLSWNISGEGSIDAMNIERSSDGNNFELIGNIPADYKGINGHYAYTDNLVNPSGDYYYRVQLVSIDGKISYSSVRGVSFAAARSFILQAINTGMIQDIRYRITADQAGTYQFVLYDMNGMKLAAKQIELSSGTRILVMEHTTVRPGIYFLGAEHAGRHQIVKLIMQ